MQWEGVQESALYDLLGEVLARWEVQSTFVCDLACLGEKVISRRQAFGVGNAASASGEEETLDSGRACSPSGVPHLSAN